MVLQVFELKKPALLLFLSDRNEKGANMNKRAMEYGWCQHKDYVGGATC